MAFRRSFLLRALRLVDARGNVFLDYPRWFSLDLPSYTRQARVLRLRGLRAQRTRHGL